MSDDQKVERQDERVEDLEVRGDEAREVAGGKQTNPKDRSKGAGKTNAGRYGGRKET